MHDPGNRTDIAVGLNHCTCTIFSIIFQYLVFIVQQCDHYFLFLLRISIMIRDMKIRHPFYFVRHISSPFALLKYMNSFFISFTQNNLQYEWELLQKYRTNEESSVKIIPTDNCPFVKFSGKWYGKKKNKKQKLSLLYHDYLSLKMLIMFFFILKSNPREDSYSSRPADRKQKQMKSREVLTGQKKKGAKTRSFGIQRIASDFS